MHGFSNELVLHHFAIFALAVVTVPNCCHNCSICPQDSTGEQLQLELLHLLNLRPSLAGSMPTVADVAAAALASWEELNCTKAEGT